MRLRRRDGIESGGGQRPRPALSAGVDVRVALGGVAGVAFLVRILHAASLDTIPVGDMALFVDMTTDRLTLGTLFSPEGSCWLPPGYAIFLKPFFLLAAPATALVLVRIAHALLGAWTCLLLYRLAARLHSRQAGLVAALIACFYPHLVFYTSAWLSENLFIPGYLAAMLLILRARGPGARYRLGLVLGALSLVSPAGLTLLPPALVEAVRRRDPTRRAASGALVMAGLVTVLLPWSARNWLGYGLPVLISPSVPVRMLASFDPSADLPREASTQSPEEIRRLVSRLLETTSGRAIEDPFGLVLSLSKHRWRDLWELRPPWPLDTANPALFHGEVFFPFVPWHVVLAMGLVGMGVLVSGRRKRAWLVPAGIVTWVAWAVVYSPYSRTRLPIEPLFIVAAGAAAAEAARRVGLRSALDARRLAGVLSLALVVLTAQAACQSGRVRAALARPDSVIAREEQFPLLPASESRTLFGRERIPLDRGRGRYLRLGLDVYRQGPPRREPDNGALWIEYYDRDGDPLRWTLQSAYLLGALPVDRWAEVNLKSHIPPAAASCHVYLLADPSSPDVVIVDRATLRYSDGNDLALEFLFPYLRRRE